MKYLNLYESLTKRGHQWILANSFDKNLDYNEPLYEAISQWQLDYVGELQLKDLEYEFNLDNLKSGEAIREIAKDKPNLYVYELEDDEIREELEDAVREGDFPEIYQTFIVDADTYEMLQDYGELVWYNEDYDLHFWGVMHFGTHWSYVMDKHYPKQNKERYEIFED